MTNWTVPAPTEPEKSTFLHERENRPQRPAATAATLVRRNLGLLLGLAFTLGLIALAFQTRATWETHRDWVVPMTVPIWGLGGVALGHLTARRQWAAASPGIALACLAVVLTVLNAWRATETEGQDNLRDALSIATGVVMGFTVAALAIAAVWVEARRPTKAPPSEMQA